LKKEKTKVSAIFVTFCVLNAMILSSLEGWDYTSLLEGVLILGGLVLVLLLKARLSVGSSYLYILFALSLLIPNLLMHSGLGIIVVKYLLMMLALFWLYHNTNSAILETLLVKRLVYFTLFILLLNQVLSIWLGLGEVHLNAGLFFRHRYYGLLGDSVSLYVFFLWKYFNVIDDKKLVQFTVVLITLSMGSKIVLLLILFDLVFRRLKSTSIVYVLLTLSMMFWIVFAFDLFDFNLIQYSLNTRMFSNTWALRTFIAYPFAGVGFNQSIVYLALENFYKIAEDGLTFKVVLVDNTMLRLLSENGFFGIASYILALIILMRKIEGKVMVYILLLLQTFHWLEPISSALFSVMLIGLIYRSQKSSKYRIVV
jgi:hypothetical protein